MLLDQAIDITLYGCLALELEKCVSSRLLTLIFCVPQFIDLILIGYLILCVNALLDVGYGNLKERTLSS